MSKDRSRLRNMSGQGEAASAATEDATSYSEDPAHMTNEGGDTRTQTIDVEDTSLLLDEDAI